jgi:hypothetical protein
MSTQTKPDEMEWFAAENEFEFQISLERAFAQLEHDDSNSSRLKCLKVILTLSSQNQSIEFMALQIQKDIDETTSYLNECLTKLVQYPPIQACWKEYGEPESSLLFEQNCQIDLLAGQSIPNANPKIVREAQIFRAALLSYADKPKNEFEIPYPHIWENVLARLESDGLIKKPQPSWFENGLNWFKQFKFKNSFGFQVQYYKPAFAVVASLLVAIIILPRVFNSKLPESDNSEILSNSVRSKGTKPCINEIAVSQPEVAALQKQKELEALGFSIDSLEKKGENKWRLKATLPAVKSKNLDTFLKVENLEIWKNDKNEDYLCITFLSKES